ncbi:MAG: folP [Deltaproteobacteria bacterium]|jgi:dihydropteroate synthase|nr:folP [Deltaproteobacteria bacterium]
MRLSPASATPPPRKPLYANLAGVKVGDGFPVRIVGVLNVSPESFYRGSVARGTRALQRRAERMVNEGAAILDIGAMSTAPYLEGTISEDDEVRRMVKAIDAVRQVSAIPLSADTQRSRVAAAALDAGACLINDVSGLAADPAMAGVARSAQGVILMASEQVPSPAHPITVILTLLRHALRRARAARIAPDRIVVDPGIGFFRRAALPWHAFDCVALAQLSRLRQLGHPVLVGVSRKSFLGRLTGREPVEERLFGSLAATALAVAHGAALVRTHDVAPTRDAIRVAEAVCNASGSGGPRDRQRAAHQPTPPRRTR